MKKSLKLVSAALATTISISIAPAVWANPPKNNQSTQSSQPNSVIRILTVDDLYRIRELANGGENFEGKTIVLENNLYISEDEAKIEKQAELSPMFKQNGGFKGTFDGNGKTLQFHATSSNIFGLIGENGTVKNLNITGRFKGNLDGGILTMYNGGTIDNCHVNVTAECTNSSVVGMCSLNGESGIIKNCSVEGDFSTNSMDCAGICDINDGTIDSCNVSGKFTNHSRILDKDHKPFWVPETSAVALFNNGRVTNCHVDADLINTYSRKLQGCASGIVSINKGLIENSTFKGTVAAEITGKIASSNYGKVKLCN